MTHQSGMTIAIAALLAIGCSEDGGRDVVSGGGVDSLGTEGSAGGEGAGTAGDDDDKGDDGGPGGGADESGDGPSFDLGQGGADGLPPIEEGCRAVDFLFVIDNSVSMQDQQAALVGAFPGFIAAIEEALDAESDYHILVTDTDAWGRCDTANPWAGMDSDSNTCNNYIQSTVFEECDRTRGAGVIHPAGQFASNGMCEMQGGKRYMTSTEPDLAGTFACAATVGVAGHPSERPMDAIVEALKPAINGAGGCNDGFLRDDALLVITFVSDDPNWEDTGMPADWYQAVVDAKLGDPSAVVVLGLTPAWEGCQDGKGPPKGEHWKEFIEMWGDNGMHGNVCGTADEYVTFFQAAVSTIDQACDEYTPPG